MLLESLLPSGFALVLGFSGILVGLLRFLGLLSDPTTATLAWFLTSMVLTVGALPFIKKYFGGESTFKVADEDYEAMDQIVDVVEDINDKNNEGRIRYQGISWQARTIDGVVPAGSQVRMKYRGSSRSSTVRVQNIFMEEVHKKNSRKISFFSIITGKFSHILQLLLL